MKRRVLLKKIMTMARTGEADSFQNFYILTVSETYGKIFALLKEKKQAEDRLVQVYLSLYHQVHTLPVEEDELMERVEEEIYAQMEYEPTEEEWKKLEETYPDFPEERAATLWLRIEEAAGLNQDQDREEESASWKTYVQTGVRILGAAAAFFLVLIVFYQGLNYMASSEPAASMPAPTVEEVKSFAAELVIEAEKQQPGWRESDGKLYYINKNGLPAEGQLFLGKQTMTFSREGELLLIGENRKASENRNLSFDEDVCYEVKNGDIYCTRPGEETFCAVRNGHVVQADVRCGYLWYICEYQIPNSDQVRTVINRAQTDGEEQTEIYAGNSILELGSFQVTSDWYYYLLDGKLFRKSLRDGKTELLARGVDYYFAWEDTAYYRKDRELLSASRGILYSGLAAGYNLEQTEEGFVLLNESGETVPLSGNGEVQVEDRLYQVENGVINRVEPASRKDGSVSYYIDKSSSDRKLYWKDANGSRGLVAQEGIAVDSFCIAGEWLYYSARTAQYGAECESCIYRINLRTSQTETVGGAFRGIMQELYYFEHVQTVYGEYISSVADQKEIHGSIAKISENKVTRINDTPVRPESEDSDLLELVMVSENRIYCLYHPCVYDPASGTFRFTGTEPLELEIRE